MTEDPTEIPADQAQVLFGAHELESVIAGKMRKYIETRLHTLRAKNDSDLEPIPTAKVRGEIKALMNLKNLLAVNTPRQMVADEE